MTAALVALAVLLPLAIIVLAVGVYLWRLMGDRD